MGKLACTLACRTVFGIEVLKNQLLVVIIKGDRQDETNRAVSISTSAPFILPSNTEFNALAKILSLSHNYVYIATPV